MKSIVLPTCLVAGVCLLATAISKSDEQGKDSAPPKSDASDKFIGKEAGQVRDDNGLKMKLVWCPPGKFIMGSPKSEGGHRHDEDQVEVTLTKGFWLGQHEITQSAWKVVMATEPWKGQKHAEEGDDFPAIFVGKEDALQFCRKLTELERKARRGRAGLEYTLPTEAQWEYACRAGTDTKFSFGDDETRLGEYDWCASNAFYDGEPYAHRVGRKKPNPWGLYDMHGNVFELCRDWYSEKRSGGRDPEVTEESSFLVIRGGCFVVPAQYCRSACRARPPRHAQTSSLGFRVAWTQSGKK